ncbi:HAMP domain-containing sensor histidine kinase [Rhodococcus aerolatus]
MRPPTPLTRGVSLRGRVTLMAATVVGVSVALMAGAAFLVVQRSLYDDLDTQLRAKADTIVVAQADPDTLRAAAQFSTDIQAAIVYANGFVVQVGSTVPLGPPEIAVATGAGPVTSIRTTADQRVYAQRVDSARTLVIAEPLAPTRAVLSRLGIVLVLVGGGGILLAAAAGATVGRAGLRPVSRLTAATERVARTDELDPIPVTGDDELARLTMSFNAMLQALGESRDRQRRLVADAGHELRTPLTSLRTNVELLAAASRPGAPSLGEEDRADLYADVTGQIEELSTLVGDLVELARDDAPVAAPEPLDLGDVVSRALERARRRRTEVEFVAEVSPWWLDGDAAALERAVLNLLDNAAKWSPAGERVEVSLHQVGEGQAELTVADAGSGIAPEDRALVFERFWRATSSRSMPGSGLGLAIVRQVALTHGGTVWAEQSPAGGALIRLRLPGRPG